VRGYSFAGAPGVIIGHNDRIAWGLTNVNPDVQDLYIERLNPEDINQYEVNGEWVDMEMVYEEIAVQGRDEPVVLPVRETRHGPIITDLGGFADYAHVGSTGENPVITALALRWTALEPNQTFRAVLLLDKAQTYDDFREALRYFDSPSQNIIYADVEGNIGYQMPGIVPIRANGDGSLPVPGWTDDYEWVDFIPYDELPRAFNPEKGYIATANQPVVDEAYPYLILYEPDFDQGYRARRIVEMLEADTDGISIEDIQAIQGDNLDGFAPELIPYLEDIPLDSPELEAARDCLLAWDGQMHMDSPEAALYGYFWVALIESTFQDELPGYLSPDDGSSTRTIFHNLLQDPGNPWWDDITTGETETRDDILARALEEGYAAGVAALGDNLDDWRWGEVHTALFANQTFGQSGIGLIEGIFNRGPVAVGGGSGSVDATGWGLADPFRVTDLPSMRQIIDLGDLSSSLMMHTTGQSGHPGHCHYDDFIDSWRLIDYHPTLWLRADVEATSRGHLTLMPTP
jgi:penicillin amidase